MEIIYIYEMITVMSQKKPTESGTADLVKQAKEELLAGMIPNIPFTELIETYQDMVFTFCFAMLKNRNEAWDALQETFLKGYTSIGDLKNPESFVGWLRQIARNVCLGIQRKRSVPLQGNGEEPEIQSHYLPPEDQVIRNDASQRIISVLRDLREVHRIPLILYYFSGKSQKEIADFLGLGIDAVKKRIQRGKEQIRGRMKDMLEEELELPSKERSTAEKISFTASFAYAANLGQLTLLEQMLVDGINVDQRDCTGKTLLHWAAEEGRVGAVRLLLRSGAGALIEDREGRTPENLARRAGHSHIVSLISEYTKGNKYGE